MKAHQAALPGGRWHFQHGPIDLIIAAEGEPDAVAAAHATAWLRFEGLLAELVAELRVLRQPVEAAADNPLQGPVARRMWAACVPLRDAAQGYLTPMAAVAGAVAQEIVAAYQRPGITRAWVNNGGDIALHLAPGAQATVGLYADLARFDAAQAQCTAAGQLRTDGQFTVHAADAVRGVATSGWRGRSHSRGIADSVTVLAATAALADAAATVVANAVDVADAAIRRAPANTLRDDSDLGALRVTVDVPPLAAAQVQRALARGLFCAQQLQARGLIHAAVLVCQGSLARLPAVQPLELAAELVQ
jgi:ApbE superfamily uncharacterized protein (UPF0280 family)